MRDNSEEKINTARSRSFQHERELARKLWELGFAVVRGPASGAKAKRIIQPDLVAIMNKHIYVLEIKTSKKIRHIYIEKTQVNKIKEFAKRSGGKPLIAIKIIGSGKWKLITLDKLEDIGDRYKIDKDIIKYGLTVKDLYKEASHDQKLDKFSRTKRSH